MSHGVKKYGAIALGVTNSQAQYEFASERIAAEGLGSRAQIRLCDYRDLEGVEAYDKIVSVGMYEHVGLSNLPLYFATIARLLRPGGALLNHGIVTTDVHGKAQGPPGGEFINRHVFPGGELPNLPHALREVIRSGLEPADIEDLRPHYVRTLLLWSRRLEAQSTEVIAAGGIERFRVCQILAYKPAGGSPASRPWTRAYQYCLDGQTALTESYYRSTTK